MPHHPEQYSEFIDEPFRPHFNIVDIFKNTEQKCRCGMLTVSECASKCVSLARPNVNDDDHDYQKQL